MSVNSTRKRSRAPAPRRKADWSRFDAVDDAEIAAAVKSDPDAAPLLTPAWLRKAKLVAPPDKALISIRLDKDVLAHFRGKPRYQTRINAILRIVMEEERRGRR
jgi:uncharacterized protein (DUF4415 family)